MKASSTFQRALLSLSHPLSIAAIAAVLLNDHLLRHVWPSWFTGKIGDFAWLIFAPFLLAALVGLLPIRSSNRDNLIGQGSIVAVGLIFGLTKTVPKYHALVIKMLETLTGWPNVLRIDPTDLIALPALFIVVWIWRQSACRSFQLPNRGLVLLPLAILATMVDSPAPDFGICDIKVGGSVITTRQFTSQDGGLTWQGQQRKLW